MKNLSLSTIFSVWAIGSHAQAAGFANDNCTSTSTLPPITISTPAGGNQPPVQVYTVTYGEFCPTGLTPKVSTITESCQETQCQPRGANAPPDFTSAEVVCQTCNSGQPLTETLTYPVVSEPTLSQLGYIINHSQAKPTPIETQPVQDQPTSEDSTSVYPGGSSDGDSDVAGLPTTVPTAGGSVLYLDYLSSTLACLLGFAVTLF